MNPDEKCINKHSGRSTDIADIAWGVTGIVAFIFIMLFNGLG